MSAMQQNPDGSWSEAVPLGWQGHAIDFEVGGSDAAGWTAHGYDEDMLVEVITAKSRRKLSRKMRKAAKRHGMSWTEL